MCKTCFRTAAASGGTVNECLFEQDDKAATNKKVNPPRSTNQSEAAARRTNNDYVSSLFPTDKGSGGNKLEEQRQNPVRQPDFFS